MDHDQSGIVFVMARVEQTHHLHLFQAGQNPSWRDLAIGCNERDRIAYPQAQLPGQIKPQNHTKLTRLQGFNAGHAQTSIDRIAGLRRHASRQIDYVGLQARVDAPNQHTLHVFAPR